MTFTRWHGGTTKFRASRATRPWLNEFSFKALRRAAQLIADSETTRRALVELCGCDPERITVVPLGVSPIFQPLALGRGGKEMAGSTRAKVLIVGTPFKS